MIFGFKNLYFLFTQIEDNKPHFTIQNYKTSNINKFKDDNNHFIVTLKTMFNLQTR